MRGRIPLILAILLCSTSLALAQNTRMILEITPSHGPAGPLTVKPGEQIQFSATAWEWTSAGLKQQVQINQLTWDLDPAAFGSITSGGLLTVATQNSAPRGVVIATAQIGAVTIRSDVVVMLGSPAATHTFKGSVSDASGPVAEARISVMSVGMLPFMVTGKTDANGAFSIDVPGGTYVVRAEASGYIPEFFDDVLTQDKATEFVTDPAAPTIDNVDFILSEGGKIRGTITDAATSAPLPDAIVFAMDGTQRIPPSGSNAGYHARTDAQGNYEISGLPDGDYVVSAQAQNYIQQYYDGKSDPGAADKVTIASSSTASGIDFALSERQPDPVYTIKGSVYDNSNTPVEGAIVYAEMRNGPMLRWLQTRSHSDGSYTLEVPAGTFIVWAMKQGLVTEYYDNVPDAAQATALTLDANNTSQTGIDFNLGEGGVITGIVRDAATNAPIENAAVLAFVDRNSNPGGTAAGSHARTDAQGRYRITGLATGDWYVQAAMDGYATEYHDDASDLTAATKVAVVDGQETTGIDFELDQLPGISGTVTDAATGAPVARAIVVLDGPNSRAFAYTDASGNYHLATHPGSYKVHCSASGYVPEWYDDVTDIAQATPVTVPQTGSVTGIDFALDTFGGSIAGVVRDANGNPVADAVLRAWANQRPAPNSAGHGFGTARSAADGSYVITGLPPADYVVRAQAQDFLPEYYDDVTDMSAATKVTVAGQAVTGIDFALTRGGSISGSITDEDTGDPLAHAVVFVRSTSLRFERGARTDASGNYTVHGLPSGDYTVFSAARGYLGEYFDNAATAATATPVTVSAPSAVTGIDLALATAPIAPRSYRGQVTSRDGIPAHVLVEAVNPVSGLTMRSTTDMQGGFELQAWENAVIRVRALGYIGQYAGGTHNWKESRWEGVTGTMTFMLEAQSEAGMAEVSGTIRDASSGKGLADAWVYGMDAAGNVFFSVTGGNGGYLIPDATNGSLDIMVSEVGYETTHGDASVEDARGSADISAQRSSVTDVDDSPALPVSVRLYQNYPNPFNPSTTLRFDLPERAQVTLRVYNLLGREVATLLRGTVDAGSHTVAFDAAGLSSGLYLARLESGDVVQTRRMTLMK